MKQKLSRCEYAGIVLVTLGLFLDMPSAQVYNEHLAFTEVMGAWLFSGLRELTGYPLPLTLFEVLSYSLLLATLVQGGKQLGRHTWALLGVAALLPATLIWGLGLGLWRGQSLDLGLTQVHFVPLLSVWIVLGSLLGRKAEVLKCFALIVFYAALWRSTYAWYVFWGPYAGTLGDREFLIDHASSVVLALGMTYGLFHLVWQGPFQKRSWVYVCAVLWMLGPYVLNERRASFGGLLAAVLCLPFILPARWRQRLWPLYRRSILLGAILFVFLAIPKQTEHTFTGALRAEFLRGENLSYRHTENYDLLLGVIEQPLTGLGFGQDFPQILPLPDISFTFPLYTAIPHNQAYFLWVFAGPMGLAALMTLSAILWIVVIRSGCLAWQRGHVLGAVLGLVALSQWLFYVFFDMGLLESRLMMIVGVFAGALSSAYAQRLGDHYVSKFQDQTWEAQSRGRGSELVCDTHTRAGF